MVGAGPHSPGQGVPSAHPQGWLCLSPSCSHALFGKGNKVGGGGGRRGSLGSAESLISRTPLVREG